jgi:hypothetical protein
MLATVLFLTLLSAAPTPARAGENPPTAVASKVFPMLDGWKLAGSPSQYTPESLFEYIDGGADAFLQFDFEELLTASYIDAHKVEITVDIYRHHDADRAFGMYTQERSSGSSAIPVGVAGKGGADHLEFVVGPYYVKLAQAGGKEPSFLRMFAEKVAAKLPGTREPPAVLKCFPSRGKRPRAEKLTARDFLGYAFLHDAAAVPYDIEGAHFRLFALHGKDTADVSEMVQRYRAVGKASPGAVKREGSATITDPLNGEVLLQWSGRWLWGAVDDPSSQRNLLVEELGRNLVSATNSGGR